jgi:hypothetical protein
MKYSDYLYLYPPRPKNAIQSSDLNFWDNGTLIAQPKVNGSNCLIFTNGVRYVVMNRHGQRLTNFTLTEVEIKSLYRGSGGWMVINGEYLNKNKMDENRKVFNHKFVIFDILVLDGDYLIGSTFENRIKLLDELYDQKDSEKKYLYSISENIYRVKSYTSDFLNIYNDFINTDMLEGIVMKRKNAKLERAGSVDNNSRSQIKCRKVTKNYQY